MTRTHPSLVGTLLERRYRVDRLLARGGMSSVYRGLDTRLDRQVAIKIMDPRFADDRSFVERFVREARSAAQLHHPNVVAVHDQGFDAPSGEESGLAFLVMELVDGGTLRDLMAEQGPLDVALALSIAEPVLSALAAAHAAGLVHRDVKPENVLIGRSSTVITGGVVKVGDFGLVRAVASAGTTSSSVILGTVAYLSPEQVTTGAATARGDVYSAGILLYEMLTGQVPYTGDTALSVAYRHVNDDVPRPSELRPGLPPALDELILRVTRRDPGLRPADAGEFLAELQAVRAGLGLGLVGVPIPPPPDGDGVADAERTQPRIPAVEQTMPVSGPRGTRALTRAVPVPGHRPGPPVPPPTARPQTGPLPSRPPAPAAEKPPRDRRKLIALVALGVLVLGGLIGAFAFILNDSGPNTSAVPKLAGLSQAAAGDALRSAKLTPQYSQEFSNTVPANTVIKADPAEGTPLEPNATVSVVVSKGRPAVPDIQVGTPLAEATKAIQDQQLVVAQGTPAYSDNVASGTVLSVSPAAGTPVDLGGQVTLVLSKGPEPLPPIPDVGGRSKDEAFAILQQAGFQPQDGGEEFSQSVAAGSVTRTDPPANSPGKKAVKVFVSNAVPVPDVRFKSFDQAEQMLSGAGLQADRGGDGGGHGHGGPFDFVFQQDPQPGSMVPKGTKVKIRGFGG
ncbi:Stk1 family PASTA domain-containing Ser/Thr kinase [Amycolatopsis sp. PS_44_ISF1]|uniref:Stk1 family PASTA domain-containing Ser/Thr kinase n=1 Tax=Amycolatopsis sp. PS_44_ISF1 TaxID=2974917 RepID=UPI0028DF50E9|nr:Stk1 family PASTA domain-containing Ser/Thr kinase [Amycolatopsis sp. PS_44_ISF1]MDT8914310.1 Stk1 family PASTA domain-containing Ser/Thr kinase [Amycolatopsis sp. PS_44_ISF1]